MDTTTKVKRKRPDIAAKKKERKNTNETCVKACLLQSLYDNAFKESIATALRERAETYSRRIHAASLAACGLLKELFHNIEDADLPSFHVPVNLFDQTTARQLMLGSAGKRPETVNTFIADYEQRHPRLFPALPRHSADSNIYSHGATQYVTVLKNTLWMRLEGRVRSFLKRSFPQKKDRYRRVTMMYRILGWSLPPSVANQYTETTDDVAIIDAHRNVLGLQGAQKADDTWFKDATNLWSILKYYVFLNRHYARNGLPEFNIVPIFKIKRHFCYVDTYTFYGVLKDAGAITCNEATFKGMADYHWRSVFNIRRLEGAKNIFTGSIQTDGITVVVHFRRPSNDQDQTSDGNKKKAATLHDIRKPNDRIVAIDPGRVNIFYGVEKASDGHVVSYKLTRSQYYKEAGMHVAIRKTQHWQNTNILDEHKALSNVSTKGVCIHKHRAYLEWHNKHSAAVWNEHMKPRWARQRFRLYGAKKRVFANFFNTIANKDPSKRVVVAYGSAKFAPGGRGELAVPTTRAYKECRHRFPTAMVDEFRTTKISSIDDKVLEQVQRLKHKGKGSNTVLRGLLWSSTSNKFVNRDRNAALNILRCATLAVRPSILTRHDAQGALKQRIGKWIH